MRPMYKDGQVKEVPEPDIKKYGSEGWSLRPLSHSEVAAMTPVIPKPPSPTIVQKVVEVVEEPIGDDGEEDLPFDESDE